MADPKRLESPLAAEAAGRDSRTEALLVEGLDRYFAGEYEEAIHIWTRVLFLDRAHARARAYIDRGRTALAERQRHVDEMLQTTDALLEQGQTEAARDLLTEAIATSGEDEKASALRLKLERLERLSQLEKSARRASTDRIASRAAGVPAIRRGWVDNRRGWVLVGAAALLGVILVTVGSLGMMSGVPGWLANASPAEQLVTAPVASKWPAMLSSSQVALVRARNLYGQGRLAEALLALERVDVTSPLHVEADALRVEIQQLLLARGPERVAPKVDRR